MKNTRTDIKKIFNDVSNLTSGKFSLLIDALWRDYLVMYAENKLAYSDLHLVDETDPLFDEHYRYVRNNFRTDEGDLVNSWSTAQGYGHQILADFAQVFGFFNYALSQFETVMGPFAAPATIATDHPSAKSWKKTDRLFTLGNGTDNLDRSNALVIYKSGLVEWYNAQVFGAYSHQNPGEPEITPKDGTLQFTLANNFEYWKNGQWNSLQGDDGANGLSAYEIAVENGFVGTELEWLDSLHGTDGEPGADAPDKYYDLTDTPAAPPATPERGYAIVTQAGTTQKHNHATAIGQDATGPWFGTTAEIITYGNQICPYPEVREVNGWQISAECFFLSFDRSGAWFSVDSDPTGVTGYIELPNVPFVNGQKYELDALLVLDWRTTGHQADLYIGAQHILQFGDLHLQQSRNVRFEHTQTSGNYTVRFYFSNFETPYSAAFVNQVTITEYSVTAGVAMRAVNGSGATVYRLPTNAPTKGNAILAGDNGELYFGEVEAIIPDYHNAAVVDDNSTDYATITPEQVFSYPEAVRNLFAALVTGTAGDILYHNGTTWVKLPKGSNGQILKLVSDIPAWAAESSGGGVPGTETLTYASQVTINWNGKTTKYLEITGDCELLLGTPANYVVRVEISGNHSLTLPSAGIIKIEGTYNGAGINVIDFVPTASGVTLYIDN